MPGESEHDDDDLARPDGLRSRRGKSPHRKDNSRVEISKPVNEGGRGGGGAFGVSSAKKWKAVCTFAVGVTLWHPIADVLGSFFLSSPSLVFFVSSRSRA